MLWVQLTNKQMNKQTIKFKPNMQFFRFHVLFMVFDTDDILEILGSVWLLVTPLLLQPPSSLSFAIDFVLNFLFG